MRVSNLWKWKVLKSFVRKKAYLELIGFLEVLSVVELFLRVVKDVHTTGNKLVRSLGKWILSTFYIRRVWNDFNLVDLALVSVAVEESCEEGSQVRARRRNILLVILHGLEQGHNHQDDGIAR